LVNSVVSGRLVGLEASTSALSAAKVAGTPAKVRLPCRRVTGSWRRPRARFGFVAHADRGERLGRFHEEAREHPLVAHQLGEEVIGGRDRGREVFGRRRQLATGAGVLFGHSLDELREPLARLGVERVEQLVEVGHRLRGAGRQLGARGERRPVVGPRRQRDVAVGDA